MHCKCTDTYAQLVKASFSSLSESYLQKAQQFNCSTSKFSPPTISLATPTDMQALTRRYMAEYMERPGLMDPMLKTWWLESSVPDIKDCILILKTDLHLYDGDSGEVALHERSSKELKKLKNHNANVRFRIKYNDAPEIDTAIRL